MKSIFLVSKKIVISPYLSLVIRFYLGIIFIYASMHKIHYPAEFAEAIAAYQVLPYWAVNFVAVVMPWFELFCGLFLIIGLKTKTVAFAIGSLLVVFIIGIIINIARGAPISCGCFDTIGNPMSLRDVLRDVSWLALTAQVFFFDRIYLFRKEILTFKKRAGDNLSASRS